jgi:hypothetical protein
MIFFGHQKSTICNILDTKNPLYEKKWTPKIHYKLKFGTKIIHERMKKSLKKDEKKLKKG